MSEIEDKELERLQKLCWIYNESRRVCDPVEYVYRQQKLIHAIAEYLLEPLNEMEKKACQK